MSRRAKELEELVSKPDKVERAVRGKVSDLQADKGKLMKLAKEYADTLSEDDDDLESSLFGGMGSRGGRFRKFGNVGGRIRLSGLPRGPI